MAGRQRLLRKISTAQQAGGDRTLISIRGAENFKDVCRSLGMPPAGLKRC